jgi:hypothetical protein
VKKKEWKEDMMEEYQSIMKNDVWEIMSRPNGKSVVTSKMGLQDKPCSEWKYR